MRLIPLLFLITAALLIGGCQIHQRSATARIRQAQHQSPNIHYLHFDMEGHIINANAAAAAAKMISRRASNHTNNHSVVLLSLGWNYTPERMVDEYEMLITNFMSFNFIDDPARRAEAQRAFSNEVDIIAISWDSTHGSVRRILNDTIPTPKLNNWLGTVPDLITLPITFWSKAALADKIGYGELRTTVEWILTEVGANQTQDSQPGLYLLGHSFGCRILAGVINERLGRAPVESFKHADLVQGALFIQPALVELNAPNRCKRRGVLCSGTGEQSYPVVITQSRHDHANGVLYPVGNAILNAYTFSATAARLSTLQMGGTSSHETTSKHRPWIDVPRLLGSFAWTAIAVPLNYGYNQVFQLSTRGIHYPMDTLANVPIAEIPITSLGNWIGLGREGKPQKWGRSHRGALGFGAINESAARANAPILGTFRTRPATPLDVFLKTGVLADSAGLQYVDATEAVSNSFFFNANLNHPLNRLWAWMDPIGSHTDYRKADVMQLIHMVLGSSNRSSTKTARGP